MSGVKRRREPGDALERPLAVLLEALGAACTGRLAAWSPRDVARAAEWARLVQGVVRGASEAKRRALAPVVARARAALGAHVPHVTVADLAAAEERLLARVIASPALPHHPQRALVFRAAAGGLGAAAPDAFLALCARLARRRAATAHMHDALAVLERLRPPERGYWLRPATVAKRGAMRLLSERARAAPDRDAFCVALVERAAASDAALEALLLGLLPDSSVVAGDPEEWMAPRVLGAVAVARVERAMPAPLVDELARVHDGFGKALAAHRVDAVLAAARRLDGDAAAAAAARLAALRACSPRLRAHCDDLAGKAGGEPVVQGMLRWGPVRGGRRTGGW